ncbi:MAG: Enoyl-CoA hydratase/isomerase family protein [Bradyrhizobium sp.]|nr:Enoyl-CoA hydratase/isomerase family protein [Bradyrhizobium sp.]
MTESELHIMTESQVQRIGYLALSHDGHIATITIDRAEKLNALSNRFWADLRAALAQLAADGSTRVVIITGAGDKAFSVGGDIAGFSEMSGQDAMRRFQIDAMEGFDAVERCPLIVIAAVNGYALGGGCELTLACDVVIASDNARFGMPEAALGLIPGFGAIRAGSVIGVQMTKFLIATCDHIDAQRAYEIGLVQKVVDRKNLMDEARGIAARIVRNSPLALAIGKRLINYDIDRRSVDYSVEAITVLQDSEDRREGVAAFLEKRAPNFQHR